MDWDSLYEWAANKTDERLWPLSEDARSMMLHVLDLPSDRTRKLIIADYFDEQELDPLGNAFRWCAKKRRFPYSKQHGYGKVFWIYRPLPDYNILNVVEKSPLFAMTLQREEIQYDWRMNCARIYRGQIFQNCQQVIYNIPALETAVLIAMIDLGNALMLAEKK